MKKLSRLRDSIKKEKTEVENKGVKVVINGNMQVEDIQLNEELDQKEQEKVLKNSINEGIKKMQQKFAEKMQEMRG